MTPPSVIADFSPFVSSFCEVKGQRENYSQLSAVTIPLENILSWHEAHSMSWDLSKMVKSSLVNFHERSHISGDHIAQIHLNCWAARFFSIKCDRGVELPGKLGVSDTEIAMKSHSRRGSKVCVLLRKKRPKVKTPSWALRLCLMPDVPVMEKSGNSVIQCRVPFLMMTSCYLCSFSPTEKKKK